MAEQTPEQKAFRTVREGFHVFSANAGTGKTFGLTEIFRNLYAIEEKRLYPTIVGHVEGKRQWHILRQFRVITFTRPAAKEINDRLYKIMEADGIPLPRLPGGELQRIAVTLDAAIQKWFRAPAVFKAWMEEDLDIRGTIDLTLQKLATKQPEELFALSDEDSMDEAPPVSDPRFGFFKRWEWLGGEGGDTLDAFILEQLLREENGLPTLAGVPPLAEWSTHWDEYLKGIQLPEGTVRFGGDFWGKWTQHFHNYHRQMRGLHALRLDGRLITKEQLDELKVWDLLRTSRREFLRVYEIARAKGYHPVRGVDNLAKLSVLKELASTRNIVNFKGFHDLALRYYSVKVRHLLLDFGDFLNNFVDLLEKNPGLLERDTEYPRPFPFGGIRTKYTLYDEVQDNSPFQNKILSIFRPRRDVPYCTVVFGDVKQAIYSFKGAMAYGFAEMIKRVREKTPENFHTLTCSFRSAERIVELGNEIVRTLPHYRDSVHPSVTIFNEPGHIVVAPPASVQTIEGEASWAISEINRILSEESDSKIMVLHRNNLTDHPIFETLKILDNPRITMFTVHRAKGLEADHVFVLGLTATLFPDPRGNYTQEVNLFYVACTRARRALYLSSPTTKRKIDDNGSPVISHVGPSPFLYRVPGLFTLAENAGWAPSQLQEGESSHKQAQAIHLQLIQAKEVSLRKEWREIFPAIPISDDDPELSETGGSEAGEEIKKLERHSIYNSAGPAKAFSREAVNERLEARVKKLLQLAYRKNGDVPRLKANEYSVAMKAGWIVKSSTRGMCFSPSITEG